MNRFGRSTAAAVMVLTAGVGTAAAQDKAPLTPEQVAALTKMSQNPVGNLISIPFQNNTSYGLYSPYDRTQNVLNIQPVIPIHLNPKWNLITRTIIPIVWQPDFAPSGTTSGLGDINVSLFLSPANPGKLIWGLGAALAFPTGSPATLSAGKYTAGPSFVVLTIAGPWVAGLLANNTWSYAGAADKAEVNFFYSQVFINYNFGKTGWYLTTAPIITANWLAASAGNIWTVPLGGGGGKLVKFGKLPVNMNVQAYGYAAKPTGGPDWTLRLQAAVLLPSPGSIK